MTGWVERVALGLVVASLGAFLWQVVELHLATDRLLDALEAYYRDLHRQ